MSKQANPLPLNGRFNLLSLLILSVILLSSCTGVTYPNPIPCGDTDLLIRAIEISNGNSGPDTIELAAGCVYELTEVYDHGGIVGSTGLPQITSEITIVGHGATIVRSTAESTPQFRLILVERDGDLFLRDLTLQNGFAYDPVHPTDVQRNSGGAIRNIGHLTVERVTIQDNSASVATGGIWNEGYMAMIKSSISGSHHFQHVVTFGAVALQNYSSASALIVQSTFYQNNEPYNYIISNMETATMTIENSTISRNNGQALHSDGDLDLIFCTIADNAEGIADIGYDYPNFDIIGTVFQNTRDCNFDSAVLATNLNNMDSDGTCGFTYTVPASDQGLLPLADNGGATLTHALDPASPAIDAVIGDCPVYEDQRDVTRPQNANCDIGAYEHDGIIPPVGAEVDIPPTETPVVPPVDDPGDGSGGDKKDDPTHVPDRCELFDSQNAELVMHDIPYGDTTLDLYVEFPHPLPGLEEEIPWDTRSWEYSATLGQAVAEQCVYRGYSGRIYCTFELTTAYFGNTYPLNVMVNFCDIPVFSHAGVSIFEPDPPPTDTPTPIACNVNLGPTDCAAAGGTYYDQNQVCACP